MSYERKPYKKGNWGSKNFKPTFKSKRGELSPLMTEEQKQEANIQDLSMDFASRIIRLYQYLNEDADYKEYVMSKQVLRSGTSIGANVREAQHAQSDADFLSKMNIAYKEADETDYWLTLLHSNGYISETAIASLSNDIKRILRLLTTIVKSTKSRIQKSKEK